MANCAKCGAALAPGAAFCGSCGAQVSEESREGGTAVTTAGSPEPAATVASSAGLSQNVAGMLAYFTIVGTILMMVIEPYSKDRFVRFHAFQALFWQVAWVALWIAAVIVGWVPFIGGIVLFLAGLALGLGGFILWIFLVFKAYNNQKFYLPVVGKMAEEQANK